MTSGSGLRPKSSSYKAPQMWFFNDSTLSCILRDPKACEIERELPPLFPSTHTRQWWYRLGITATDTLSKKRGRESARQSLVMAILKSSQVHPGRSLTRVWSYSLGVSLHDSWLCFLCLFLPSGPSFFILKKKKCLQLSSFLNLLPAYTISGVERLLILYCLF